jgi:hypothetical protein
MSQKQYKIGAMFLTAVIAILAVYEFSVGSYEFGIQSVIVVGLMIYAFVSDRKRID